MYNPVANLQRSRQRQHYVLRRMSELDILLQRNMKTR